MTTIYTGKPKKSIPSPSNLKPYDPSNNDFAGALDNISFSGVDAIATMIIPTIGEDGQLTRDGDAIEIAELQTISYSIHRENSPVRTLGHVNPRGFIKGGRTIAGSLIFAVFNEYAFYKIKQYRDFLQDDRGFFAPLADMLPPFDIVLTFVNEYGHYSKMKIFGVTIIAEGQVVSIEDVFMEQTYTFMARGIQPLVKMEPERDSRKTEDPDFVARNIQISRNIFGDETVQRYTDATKYLQNMIDLRESL
jgi:hypothetical protein